MWLGDYGRWLPVGLPGHPANLPESPRAKIAGRPGWSAQPRAPVDRITDRYHFPCAPVRRPFNPFQKRLTIDAHGWSGHAVDRP
jgi:hypothetical protein